MATAEQLLAHVVERARANVRNGGRPFAAVVVMSDTVIAEGVNEVVSTGDPTAHAELLAIRSACRALGRPRLEGGTVYASGQPCPMCLSAMYLTGIAEVAYVYSNEEGKPFGLSTAAIYEELARPIADQSLRIRHTPLRSVDLHPYEMWRAANVGSS